MRVHVVGVSSLGSLVSFHIRRTARLLADNVQYIRTLPNQQAARFFPAPYDLGVALRVKRSSFVKDVRQRAQSSIIVERDNIVQRESGFGVQLTGSFQRLGGSLGAPRIQSTSHLEEESLPGISICEQLGYPEGSIDVVLVTTRPQVTLASLEPLAPFLTRASTVILLQSGQGVLDQLIGQLFTDPLKRPNFILANSTHDAWQKGLLHTVHAKAGTLDLGVVPNDSIGTNYERLTISQHLNPDNEGQEFGMEKKGAAMDILHDGERIQEVRDTASGIGTRSHHGFEQIRTHAKRGTGVGVLKHEYSGGVARIAQQRNIPQPSMLDLSAIPQNENTQTLVGSLAILLSLPLNVTWSPIRQYQMHTLRQLVVSACIEPLTALIACRTGDLYANRHAENVMRDVCNEASIVLEKMAEHSFNEARLHQERRQQEAEANAWSHDAHEYLLAPHSLIGDHVSLEAPFIHASLRPGALFAEVQRAIRANAPRYSSMYNELHRRPKIPATHAKQTEVAHINGYLARLGRSLGVQTPVNDMLMQMIMLKATHTATTSWPITSPNDEQMH